jgi:hypothetical protein
VEWRDINLLQMQVLNVRHAPQNVEFAMQTEFAQHAKSRVPTKQLTLLSPVSHVPKDVKLALLVLMVLQNVPLLRWAGY